MPVERGRIPELPLMPRARSVARHLHRSYPVGHQQFSRALAGVELELTISTPDHFSEDVRVNLVTTINADGAYEWLEVPFVRVDESTFACRITPGRPGLYTFRAQFSLDGWLTKLRDQVPDAWVLVDPPQIDDMRLYTMLPTVSGTVQDWTADLRRIKAMGFNAIHLLPITSLDESESPYSAHDLFDIDHSYVASDVNRDRLSQLEEFIEEAKALEMRLCFDLVLNHVGVTSNIARRAPDWIVPDESSPDGFKRARFWSDKGWQIWEDIVLINYEHPSDKIRAQIWDYMTHYALFWAKYADYTHGFVRFDNLHSSDGAYQHSLTQSLRNTYPNLGIIAEYFTDDDTLLNSVPVWGLNLLLATPWNHKFVPQLREYLRYIHRISEQIRYFMPITSHDSGSPAQEFGSIESTVPRYVAAALLGTGATGITQGVEWGDPLKTNFIGRHPKREQPDEAIFEGFIRTVNQILTDHTTFRRGNNCHFVDNDHHAIIAAFRKDSKTENGGYLVICNFDTVCEHLFEADLEPFLGDMDAVTCRDLLTGEEWSFPSARVRFVLQPCVAKVLVF